MTVRQGDSLMRSYLKWLLFGWMLTRNRDRSNEKIYEHRCGLETDSHGHSDCVAMRHLRLDHCDTWCKALRWESLVSSRMSLAQMH